MKEEVIDFLKAKEGGVYLDCTLGGGGHTMALLEANENNCVVAFDRDERAISRNKKKLERYGSRVRLVHSSFANASKELKNQKFDGVLADLGTSTDQLKENRGFSFNDDTALDMRMDESQEFSAHDLVNGTTQSQLVSVLKRGGVGKEAFGVAQAIIKARPIDTTVQLADVTNQALRGRYRGKKGNPATVIFQAIRIAVNREFEEIEAILDAAPELIVANGRIAVVTFHSLEDKLVTRRMRDWESQGAYPALWRGERKEKALGKVLTKKPVTASDEEVKANPSSRSARLRVFQFNR